MDGKSAREMAKKKDDGTKIIAKGLLKETELNEHREAVVRHLNDPATTVIDKLLVQCWGQKSS